MRRTHNSDREIKAATAGNTDSRFHAVLYNKKNRYSVARAMPLYLQVTELNTIHIVNHRYNIPLDMLHFTTNRTIFFYNISIV